MQNRLLKLNLVEGRWIHSTKSPDLHVMQNSMLSNLSLKWYCDENNIFPIEPILKHKQVPCMTRKMLFTIFQYLFSFQRYLSF